MGKGLEPTRRATSTPCYVFFFFFQQRIPKSSRKAPGVDPKCPKHNAAGLTKMLRRKAFCTSRTASDVGAAADAEPIHATRRSSLATLCYAKCDEPQGTENCPAFNSQREDHEDAARKPPPDALAAAQTLLPGIVATVLPKDNCHSTQCAHEH